MNPMDDDDLAAALRGHADALTTDLDVDAAWRDVAHRARARRRWRSAATTLGVAAAAVAVIVGVVAVGGRDREVLRAPATQPTSPVSTLLPATTGPSTVPSTTAPPATAAPSTTVAPSPTTPVPAVVPPPTTTPTTVSTTVPRTDLPRVQITVVTPPSPSTSTYSANGGSITVRLAGGQLTLDGDPLPASGWSVRIDDNGPDRVRVRFEMGDQRSEIRVDLVDGQLVPRVTEG